MPSVSESVASQSHLSSLRRPEPCLLARNPVSVTIAVARRHVSFGPAGSEDEPHATRSRTFGRGSLQPTSLSRADDDSSSEQAQRGSLSHAPFPHICSGVRDINIGGHSCVCEDSASAVLSQESATAVHSAEGGTNGMSRDASTSADGHAQLATSTASHDAEAGFYPDSTPQPTLPDVSLFSFATYRDFARDRAMYGPVSGPASGGKGSIVKLIAAIICVCIIATSWDNSCETPLAMWLLGLPVGLVVYVCAIKFLYYLVRPRNPVAQEVAAFALYQAMFPLAVAWLLAGSILVFRTTPCTSGVLYLVCFYLAIICLFYTCVVIALAIVLGFLKLRSSRTSMLQGMDNVFHNRPFHSTPRTSLRSLARITYSGPSRGDSTPIDSNRETCAICLETYEPGQHLLRLPCDPPVSHVFHASCIAQWLSRSSCCPLCKKSVIRREA